MIKAYLDHASATPLRKEVIRAMEPFYGQYFANPMTIYDLGTGVKEKVEEARAQVADLLGAAPERIVFTSSGAEANNMAVKGVALANRKKGNRVIVSAVEHHSVLNSARFLERLDYEVTFLPVDSNGQLDPERLAKTLDEDTVLVSVMHANNEIGTIQHIAAMAALCKDKGVFFHADCVASVGQIPIGVEELGVDLLSISAQPIQGPKGMGALYVRKNVRTMPLIHGGIQERGMRAGTENVPGIIGFGVAAELAAKEIDENRKKLESLRNDLIHGIRERVPKATLTGHPEQRLPGHVSYCFQAIEGEALIFLLSQNGIYANTGSACASKALKLSPVLGALGVAPDVAQGSLVFTLNRTNNRQEIEHVLDTLPGVVERLRMMSPLWKDEIETAE